MLVLSRQVDESIMIGDGIEVMIVDIRGDKVRLGFKASPEVSIHRKEVYEAIQSGKPIQRENSRYVHKTSPSEKEFENNFNAGNYDEALRLVVERKYHPTSDEALELKTRLLELRGRLDPLIERRLDSYRE